VLDLEPLNCGLRLWPEPPVDGARAEPDRPETALDFTYALGPTLALETGPEADWSGSPAGKVGCGDVDSGRILHDVLDRPPVPACGHRRLRS
jgi:hypothetical protein